MLPVAPHRFFEGGKLPDAYEADGMRVALKTDFRVWLKYEQLRGNYESLTNEDVAGILIRICFINGKFFSASNNFDFFMKAIAWFHSCADSERTSRIRITDIMRETMGNQPRLICPFWDYKTVWDSFKQQYDICLYKISTIHWWEFLRLLHGLNADTPYAMRRHMRGIKVHEVKGEHTKEMQAKAQADRNMNWSLLECERAFAALPAKW